MALEIKIKNTNNVNPEGTRVYLEDVTGDYSLTNVGGYGDINPTRNSLSVHILGMAKTSKGDFAISFEPYNPATATKFNAVIPRDGWYQFSTIILQPYDEDILQSYPVNTALYDTNTGTIVKIVRGDKDPSKYAKKVELLELKGTEYESSLVETFFVANNSKTLQKINGVISDLISTGVDFKDKKLIRHKDNFNLVRAILQGAIYEYCRGNKYVAQVDMEFLNTNDYVSE